MKYFLSLETSMSQGSLGIFEIEKRRLSSLIEKEWSLEIKNNKKIHHSEKLPLEIQTSLEEINLKFKDLNFLAVGIGPGRFTGVRTAVGVIKSLAFTLKIPIYPVNSLKIVAEPFLSSEAAFCVSFNAFKNSLYFAEYKEGKLYQEPCVMKFSDWADYMIKNKIKLCLGDVPDFYTLPTELKCLFKKARPQARSLAQIVCREFQLEHLKPWFELQPLYLRSVAETNKNEK
ncbi:MAG: tRNA (adenosine(37)-N6)-threonylcarbamoyltransferase complex dimerization subunit type 1 TsaB [Bdellovibrionales bacterium]